MAYLKATIEILINVDCEAEACDALSETLRPHLREFAGADSCVVDWRYASGGTASDWQPDSGEGFEYAEARANV